MGGGGGKGRNTLGDVSSLIQKAREEIRRAEADQRRNVFLSFAYEDLNEVNLLRGQAKSDRSDIEFNDWSVREPYNSSRAEYIKQKIGERISQCSVTVVYLSNETSESDWVNWEIDESVRRDKRVLAVHKGEVQPRSLPDAIRRHKVKVVPWSRLSEELEKL